jgi:hypothetical protein
MFHGLSVRARMTGGAVVTDVQRLGGSRTITSWLDRIDPPLQAQVDCNWDPTECNDNGSGTTDYYYPFDDGNPNDSAADTEITDSSGSDGWEDNHNRQYTDHCATNRGH